MFVKLLESIFYVTMLSFMLYVLYKKRTFFIKHYIFKQKSRTKAVIFIAILLVNIVLLTFLNVIHSNWIIYSLFHAFSSAQIVFFLISIFWKNE